MTDEAPPVVNDTEQLRAQLRGIADEKNLLDSIEEDVDRKRSHADEVRAKKRQRKDETIARERAIADQERDARQDELVKLENSIRVKLKARRSLGSSLYPKHAAVPNTHPSASVGDFNFSIQQSWPEEHDSPKRPRDDNGRGITGSSQPAKVFGRTGGLGLRPNEMSPNNRRGEDPQAPATPAEDLQQTVTLPQLQSLPPLDGIADLPAFAATPYFTPKFISESIGGNIRVGGLVRVGKSRMEDQVVACEEYLAFQSAFNPYLPPAPGQHGVFLDLRHLSGEENKLNQCKILPLFISTATGRWYYSGHYSESIRAEKVKETTQRHFVSAQLLDKWLGSIFATRHALTDLGLEVLMKSNLYQSADEWDGMTKEKVRLAIQTKSGKSVYTQLPFWFRYLQCVRFDRSFNDVLLAKQRELDSQLEDGFGTGGADSPPIQSTHTAREQSRVNVTINDDDVQRRNQNMTDAIIRVRVVPNEQETFRFFGL